ncbi:MAG: oligosaccharide flippase family protein [Ignavibacteriae bacterium]|nr:oligosaccharide flippase family protein [Ignavibacteriota bacterium]
MIKDLKETFKDSAIYGFGRVSTKLVGFVLLPLYTKEISAADYGIYGILEIFIQTFVALFSLGLSPALFRWFNQKEQNIDRRIIFFTSLIGLAAFLIIPLCLGILFSEDISQLIFDKVIYGELLVLVFVLGGIEILLGLFTTLVRIYQKAILFAVGNISTLIINLLLNIYFVAVLKIGIKGILISSIVSAFLFMLTLIIYFRKELYKQFNVKIFIEMIKFGFPITFSSIGGMFLTLGDRYILKIYAPLSEVGQYTLGYKFAAVINIFFVQAFQLAWPAIAWKKINEPNAKRFFSKVFTYYSFLMFWIVLYVSVFAKGIINNLALNRDYWQASSVVPIIALSYAFNGVYYLIGFLFHFKNKTSYLPFIVLTSAVFNIVLNFILIPIWGMMGAAIVTLLSYMLMSILTYFNAQKLYPINYELNKIILAFITAIGLYYVTHIFDDFSVVLRIVTKAVTISLYPLILYFIGFYEEIEIISLKRFFMKRLNFLTKSEKDEK